MAYRLLIGWLVSFTLACTGGPSPGDKPECTVNSDCTDGRICNEGLCRTVCAEDADCGDTEVCEDPGFCAAAAAGECRDTSKCDDDNVCTYDLCDSGNACANIPLTGAACDDGDPCTADDECTAGGCAGEAYSCDDSEDCTVDTCDGDGDCFHQNTCECLESWQCDDQNECTTEICDGGSCVYTDVAGCCNVVTEATDCASPTPACDPNTHTCVECTNVTFCGSPTPHCSPARTCVACTDTQHCADDGDFCTGDEYCDLDTFACASEGDPCKDARQPSCNEDADRCDCTTAPSSCGLLTCNPSTGECEGCTGPGDCDDENPCTLDECDSVSGVCSNPSDTSLCTSVPGQDTCFPNPEVPGTYFCACTFQSTCPKNFQCYDGVCRCLMSQDECSDGTFCNGEEICVEFESGFGDCDNSAAPCTDDHPVCNDDDDRCECTSTSCVDGKHCYEDDPGSPGYKTCVKEDCRIPGDDDYDDLENCEDPDCTGERCEGTPVSICVGTSCRACEDINCDGNPSVCDGCPFACFTCDYGVDGDIDLCVGSAQRCPTTPP